MKKSRKERSLRKRSDFLRRETIPEFWGGWISACGLARTELTEREADERGGEKDRVCVEIAPFDRTVDRSILPLGESLTRRSGKADWSLGDRSNLLHLRCTS